MPLLWAPPSATPSGCRECKIRVGQLLDRIYGACVRNRRFPMAKRALHRVRGNLDRPRISETWPGFWRDIADMASARSCVATDARRL